VRKLSRTYATLDAAKAAAAAGAEHRRAARQPVSLDLSLALGDPRFAPEQRVTGTGFKAAIDAVSWLVSEVSHSIGDRGYVTTLQIEAA
jgi:phage protein D